ncbi:hypothetical protein GTY70_05985 [Stenotrophomonas maltophilia]|uniref:hypothetical protein n=1 Tax=Stenotrophomonas maltophilia group TaxID=995085 RepID=UPI001F299FEE|nr:MULTISPECIES: hypothetical protein [Stenotrophomonas]MCF3463431.1 hypothetical protein [Stenotrophomonas maltophilia]MCF3507948.1 hypothetical protein [Stenotrophomonas maltophilia]MCU1082904.1 hypothetical protein [Stenotrophomonas maltophilia]MCU1155825.1 hypothetical protein [Stenotrophomonas maltophilia]MCU1167016.1 hypothetical protein [Stenotrophomonas maltophilia]
MKFSDVRFDELSSDQLQKLPKEWLAHYLGRPTRARIISARRWLWLRSVLIAVLCIYTFVMQGTPLLATLELCLIGYEIAYYTLRNATLEADFLSHLSAYTDDTRRLPEWSATEDK